MPRKIEDSVVVVTGASSGIGRATALAFAHSGATVVVAARRAQPLEELAEQCVRLGGRALAIPTDVTREEDVRDLARRTVENFGRIDTWVNNAAVTLFSRFEEAPLDVFRRVIDTNFFGYVHGARAALPYFREQGDGVLVNVASVVGKVAQPYASAYVAAKFAIVGLSECLREELHDAPDIHVCTVMPASIDTPLFQHGANYTGRAPKPMPPVYDAEQVAATIAGLARHPRREAYVGGSARSMSMLHSMAPAFAERAMATMVEREHFQDLPAPPTTGNVFEPSSQWTGISGGWKAPSPARSFPFAFAGLAAVPALIAWLWLRPNGDRGHLLNGRRPQGLGRLLEPVASALGRPMARQRRFSLRL